MTLTLTALQDWAIDDEVRDAQTFLYEHALNARSGWKLTVPWSPARFRYWNRSGSGVRVVDNGVAWVGYTKRVVARSTGIVVEGNSALSLWADRVPVPEPLNVPGPWTLVDTHDLTGDAVTVFANLLSSNGAVANVRRLPGNMVVSASGTAGRALALSVRWSPTLLDIIEEHATAAGVAVAVTLPPGDGAAWTTTVRALRPNPQVVFDPDLGADLDWTLVGEPEGQPTAGTVAYVGGAGEGRDRLITTVTAAGPRRIERWVEGRSDVVDELAAAGRAVTDLAASTLTIELEAADTPGVTYGRNYLVGDVASIRAAGQPTVTARIVRMAAHLDTGGLSRRVTVGDGAVDLLALDPARRRLGRLEGA